MVPKAEKQSEPMRNLPKSLLIIVAANVAAMVFFIIAFPTQSGGPAIACIGLVILHALIAVGLLWRMNWARGLMIAYALFQIAAVATAAVVAILSLQLKPFTTWTATQLILAAVLIPFLWWASAYLMRDTTRALFTRPGQEN